MTDNPPTRPRATPTYELVAVKLGMDPLTFIKEKRAGATPMPFARIADEIERLTGVYVTDELPRRWLKAAEEADTAA
jgi:hypothetical protein